MPVMGRFLNHNTVTANEGSREHERERQSERDGGCSFISILFSYNQGTHSLGIVLHVVAVAPITIFLIPN